MYIVPDMEGMGSAVDSREILAGNEGAAYRDRSSPDYWNTFRSLLPREVNATIKGARLGGAREGIDPPNTGATIPEVPLPVSIRPERSCAWGKATPA